MPADACHRFYGTEGAGPLYNRYAAHSKSLVRLIDGPTACLGRLGIRPSYAAGWTGWTVLLYFIAWDHPDRVTYEVDCDPHFRWKPPETGESRPPGGVSVVASRAGDCRLAVSCPPFESRAEYEAWANGETTLAEGYCFLRLSRDVRSCTVDAIDAILSIIETGAKAGSPSKNLAGPRLHESAQLPARTVAITSPAEAASPAPPRDGMAEAPESPRATGDGRPDGADSDRPVAIWDRLMADPESTPPKVSLDGVPYSIPDCEEGRYAVRYLRVLIKAKGQWMTSQKIIEVDPSLASANLSRARNKYIPEPIIGFTDANRGMVHRLFDPGCPS